MRMYKKTRDLINLKERWLIQMDKPPSNEALRRLFLIKRTEMEMMRDRGIDISQGHLKTPDQNEFTPVDLSFMLNPRLGMKTFSKRPFFQYMMAYREESGHLKTRSEFTSMYTEPNGGRLLVVYLTNNPGKKVSHDHFQIVNEFVLNGYKRFVLISEPGLNSDALNQINTRMPSCRFDTFLDMELASNPLKHSLAPIKYKHVDNTKEWSKQENVDVSQLPLLLETDIVARWVGAKRSDVIQTELLGTTTDTMGYNRVVRKIQY